MKIQESSKDFWRVKDKSSPHNMFTSTESILEIAERKEIDFLSEKILVALVVIALILQGLNLVLIGGIPT